VSNLLNSKMLTEQKLDVDLPSERINDRTGLIQSTKEKRKKKEKKSIANNRRIVQA
jgi:hypothetical protein